MIKAFWAFILEDVIFHGINPVLLEEPLGLNNDREEMVSPISPLRKPSKKSSKGKNVWIMETPKKTKKKGSVKIKIVWFE